MTEFEHLHTHSQHSLLDGLSNVRSLCERALELGQTSVAITDHGSIAAVPELFRTAKEYGLKPIAGIEAYFCKDTKIKDKTSDTYHLTLLAHNYAGYLNLCRLVTESYRDGFYSKPRIDADMIIKNRKGLIMLSGCMNSMISDLILEGKHIDAKSLAMECQEFMGRDNFYLEYMDSGIKAQKAINMTFDRWRKQHQFQAVVTQDSHYMFEEDKDVHQTLLCIGSRSQRSNPQFSFQGGPYHFCDADFLSKRFDKSLLTTTRKIADRCEVYDIPKSGAMPSLSPKALGGKSPNQFLEEAAWAGLKTRGKLRKKNYVTRLRDELTVVFQLKYATYFIMVHAILKFARSRGILVGPGRGSSAGSLLAYCLQITDIDPIVHGLFFERFLNKDRVSPPDIDVDIADTGRQQVLDFVRQTYGEDRVAHIGSFSTMGPRQSIRDVAVAHGVTHENINGILKQVSHDPMLKFEDVKNMSAMEGLPPIVMQEAEVMAGKVRHMSTHAAGIIIADHKLEDYVPLVTRKGVVQTLYDMNEMANLGYIKFDILGLKTLGVMDQVIKKAGIYGQNRAKMWDYDDSRVYELICAGNTMGVFQLEGWGYVKMIKRYRPQNFEDIMMINALYRPGPMQGGEGLETILRRRNAEEQTTYKHPSLEPILNTTYGLPVFQEQVMRMCQVLAGFTLAEADSMRSAIGKKDDVKMASFLNKFQTGCIRMGLSRSLAQEIFEDITFFNRYGWNRAHAAAYGAVTYATAWLKTYYPHYFMAELVNKEDNPERLKRLFSECHRMGIEFDRVDINKSDLYYTVVEPEKVLLPGFANVKGVGEKAARAIAESRSTEGKFYSKQGARDRIARKVLNKTMFAALEKAGAFRELPEVEVLEEVPF